MKIGFAVHNSNGKLSDTFYYLDHALAHCWSSKESPYSTIRLFGRTIDVVWSTHADKSADLVTKFNKVKCNKYYVNPHPLFYYNIASEEYEFYQYEDIDLYWDLEEFVYGKGEEKEMPISSITFCQDGVYPDGVHRYATEGFEYLPSVVGYKGKNYLINGHHRTTARMLLGFDTIICDYFVCNEELG